MGIRLKIHRWLKDFWEEPFFRAELERVEISKRFQFVNGTENRKEDGRD